MIEKGVEEREEEEEEEELRDLTDAEFDSLTI